MKVFCYQATEDGAPSGQYVARIWGTVEGLKGPRQEWFPIIFAGPSEGSVRLQAQTYWDREMAKAEKRHGPKALKKAAPQTGVPVDEVGEVL